MKNCPWGTPADLEGSSEKDLVADGRGVISAGMLGIDLLGITGVWLGGNWKWYPPPGCGDPISEGILGIDRLGATTP